MLNIIYTVSVGDSECFKHCVNSQKKYADRIGVDFLVRKQFYNWNENLKTDCEKRYCVELLKTYDRVLYLDADVFIKDDAENVFDFYKDDTNLIMYNEVLYNNVNMDEHIEPIVKEYNINWKKTNNHYDWLNAGVILCSKRHMGIFFYNPNYFFKFSKMPMIYDMPYMHYMLYQNDIAVTYMNERFNTMVYFHDDGWFLHFANVLDRDKRILNYV